MRTGRISVLFFDRCEIVRADFKTALRIVPSERVLSEGRKQRRCRNGVLVLESDIDRARFSERGLQICSVVRERARDPLCRDARAVVYLQKRFIRVRDRARIGGIENRLGCIRQAPFLGKEFFEKRVFGRGVVHKHRKASVIRPIVVKIIAQSGYIRGRICRFRIDYNENIEFRRKILA